jgi:hypothetical protein
VGEAGSDWLREVVLEGRRALAKSLGEWEAVVKTGDQRCTVHVFRFDPESCRSVSRCGAWEFPGWFTGERGLEELEREYGELVRKYAEAWGMTEGEARRILDPPFRRCRRCFSQGVGRGRGGYDEKQGEAGRTVLFQAGRRALPASAGKRKPGRGDSGERSPGRPPSGFLQHAGILPAGAGR